MYTKKEREQYNQHRANVCEKLGITKNQYNWLRRKGEALHKLYEDNCNGLLDESRYDTITMLVEDVIEKYIKPLGLKVYYQTDPRGATIYLDKQPIKRESYNNSSCIY